MENQRKATTRQLAYIQQLRKKQGKDSPEMEEELTFQEASALISVLLGKPKPAEQTKTVRVNEPRLGIAMKECYRLWRSHGWLIFSEHRQRFKDDVVQTYQLFTEIAQELGQNGTKTEA